MIARAPIPPLEDVLRANLHGPKRHIRSQENVPVPTRTNNRVDVRRQPPVFTLLLRGAGTTHNKATAEQPIRQPGKRPPELGRDFTHVWKRYLIKKRVVEGEEQAARGNVHTI